ncbi:hypothetical protein IFM89_010918, partial [Coptis chinensis]
PETARRTSSGTSSTMRKASSTTNIVDDLTSIFGGNLVDFTLSLVPVLRDPENSGR